MTQNAHLIAIDISPGFIGHLRNNIDDPRLITITGSASSAPNFLKDNGFDSADIVVTGIPFSTIPRCESNIILDTTVEFLQENRQLLAYQMRSTIAPLLAKRFLNIQKSYVWRNIPPCHLYRARYPRISDA